MLNSFCKQYVDSDLSKGELIEVVRGFVAGKCEGLATVLSRTSVMDIEDHGSNRQDAVVPLALG